MYGMINKAVRGLVVDVAGEDAWTRIRKAARVSDDDFLSMEGYDDSVTYDLVASVSDELSMPPEEVLEAFGKYWLKYTGDEGYGALMDAAGSTLPEFLANLDNLHARIKLTFFNLVPPRFSVDEKGDRELILHYYSEREGLEPLVVGLLKGLAERFGQSIEIEYFKDDDHAAFHVRYEPPARESITT